MATVEQLIAEAMMLPSESRARLANLLIESLEGDDFGDIDQLWLTDAKRRRNEIRSGKIETIPGQKALRRVRDAIEK